MTTHPVRRRQRCWATHSGSAASEVTPAWWDPTLEVDGQEVAVVGVAPPGLAIGELPVDLWMDWQLDPSARAVNSHYVATLGRLAPGVSVDAARDEMVRLTRELPERFPNAYSEKFMKDFGFTADVRRLGDVILGDSRRPLWLLLGAVGVLLLLACANVANLYLVRTESRAREVAVRRAMGASRRELARHFMVESLLTTAAAGAAGLALAYGAIRALRALAPDSLPRTQSVVVDGRTLLFTLGVALVAGLVLGLFPLIRHGRTAPAAALGDGARGSSGREGNALRGTLVAGQMALAVVLLSAAGLMVRSALELRAVDPGFRPDGAVAVDLVVPAWNYPGQDEVYAFDRDLLTRLREMPGVEAAGLTSGLPMTGAVNCYAVAVEGGLPTEGEPPSCPPTHFVTDGYFEAMGIEVQEGRTYDARDDALRTGAAVLGRKLADAYWPDGAMGRGIRIYGAEPPFHHVVGIVDDVREQGLTQPAPGVAYFPLRAIQGESQWGPVRYQTLVVRAPTRGAAGLMEDVRGAIHTLDADVPVTGARPLGRVVARSMARTTFTMVLMALSAGLALTLGAVGLYGVVTYTVSRRRNEIGIRMALGARAGGVATMVLRESLGITVAGAAVGVLGALLTGQLLRALLFGVAPVDPLTLSAVVGLLVGVAALASFLPARRAARVDPAASLRTE